MKCGSNLAHLDEAVCLVLPSYWQKSSSLFKVIWIKRKEYILKENERKYESNWAHQDLAHQLEAACFLLAQYWQKSPSLFTVSWPPHVVAHTANTTENVSLVPCYRSFATRIRNTYETERSVAFWPQLLVGDPLGLLISSVVPSPLRLCDPYLLSFSHTST